MTVELIRMKNGISEEIERVLENFMIEADDAGDVNASYELLKQSLRDLCFVLKKSRIYRSYLDCV